MPAKKRLRFTILFTFIFFINTLISGCASKETITPTSTNTLTPTLPPTETITPLPSATATPELTAVPEENIVFSQDFENERVGYWQKTASNKPLQIISENGNHFLHFDASGSTNPGLWLRDVNANYHYYIVEMKIRIHASDFMVCSFKTNRDLIIGDNGDQAIPSRCSGFSPFYFEDVDENGWSTLRFEYKANEVAIFLNNHRTAHDQSNSDFFGGFGFTTAGKTGTTLDIDDVRVWLLK